jgi:carbonic anhydrase
VGAGNNSSLVRSILKRRYWWTISEKAENCHFVWTQLKNNNIFKAPTQQQSPTDIQKVYYCDSGEEVQIETEDTHSKIFNKIDLNNWRQHMVKNERYE